MAVADDSSGVVIAHQSANSFVAAHCRTTAKTNITAVNITAADGATVISRQPADPTTATGNHRATADIAAADGALIVAHQPTR